MAEIRALRTQVAAHGADQGAVVKKKNSELGFTLVELLVVLLVMGILMSVAILAFLRASDGAATKAAWSNVRSALSAARAAAADVSYEDVDLPTLETVEPSLQWSTAEDAPSTGAATISWETPGGEVVHLAVQTKDGDCYYIADDLSAAGGVTYAMDEASNVAATGCRASNVPQSQPYVPSLQQGWGR